MMKLKHESDANDNTHNTSLVWLVLSILRKNYFDFLSDRSSFIESAYSLYSVPIKEQILMNSYCNKVSFFIV